MLESLWMVGTIAQHTRSRILKQAAGFAAVEVQPTELGLCAMFGSDFQEGSEDFQTEWLSWSQKPGRVLLLIPPFKITICNVPTEWEITHGQGVKSSTDLLASFLVKEVRYALHGKLKIPTQPIGQWEDFTIHTGYYHKHPNAGIFVVSCLPIWSLSVLDKKELLKNWLKEIYDLSGKPEQIIEENAFIPNNDHFTAMLHLLTGDYQDCEMAIGAATASPWFSIRPEVLEKSLNELTEQGLIKGSNLTELGHKVLYQSNFAIYAEELAKIKELNNESNRS